MDQHTKVLVSHAVTVICITIITIAAIYFINSVGC
jgi:hypothetical protein